MAVRYAAYQTKTAHFRGLNPQQAASTAVTPRRLPLPDATHFSVRAVEIRLIERAFGQVYDLQRRFEIGGGETAFCFRNEERDAAGNDTAAIFPSPRSQIDDSVHLPDGAHVMFDDHDRIAGVDEALQVLHQPVGI